MFYMVASPSGVRVDAALSANMIETKFPIVARE
jgi:hypothetical protein